MKDASRRISKLPAASLPPWRRSWKHACKAVTICGNSFSAADCVTAYLPDRANKNGMLDGLRNLQAYLARMYARDKATCASARPAKRWSAPPEKPA